MGKERVSSSMPSKYLWVVNVHSLSARASELPTRESEADWGRVRSGAERRRGAEHGAGNHRRTLGRYGDRDGLTWVRFHNSNHCLISNSTESCPFCWYTLSSNEHRKSRCNSLQHSSFVISLHQYYRVADKCFSNILQYQNNSHESIHYSDLRIRARGGMTQSNKYVIAGGFIDPKKSLTLIYNDWL